MTRQVIKLGSSSIASRGGLALDVIAGLVSQIAAAQRAGHEIILVTSGAARLGRQLLAFEGPTAGAGQALAALVSSVRAAVQTADYQQLAEMLSLYVTLGVFLLLAVRNPSAYRSVIAFAAWSSLAHAAVMTVQSVHDVSERAHLLIGSAMFAVIAAALIALTPGKSTAGAQR